MIRVSVVLPVPFGPMSATFAPSPTRTETSLRSGLPSGRLKETELTSTWPTRVKTDVCRVAASRR